MATPAGSRPKKLRSLMLADLGDRVRGDAAGSELAAEQLDNS